MKEVTQLVPSKSYQGLIGAKNLSACYKGEHLRRRWRLIPVMGRKIVLFVHIALDPSDVRLRDVVSYAADNDISVEKVIGPDGTVYHIAPGSGGSPSDAPTLSVQRPGGSPAAPAKTTSAVEISMSAALEQISAQIASAQSVLQSRVLPHIGVTDTVADAEEEARVILSLMAEGVEDAPEPSAGLVALTAALYSVMSTGTTVAQVLEVLMFVNKEIHR